MQKVLIFGALDPGKAKVPFEPDAVLAADKGLLYARQAGFEPDHVFGDFDSLGEIPRGGNVTVLPVRKDKTDTACALDYAIEHGAKEIYLYGCVGGKEDHSYANMQLAVYAAEKGVFALFCGKTNICALHNGRLTFACPREGRLSVFAVGKAAGVTLQNVSFPLQDAVLSDRDPLGVSNAFCEGEASVSVTNGTLLVMWEQETPVACEFFTPAFSDEDSDFFALMARMKYIQRWGLMNALQKENIQEHSLQTAMIAHMLALIANRFFGGSYDEKQVALIAMYHEASEILTGDLPTPVKYYDPDIRDAYHRIEDAATAKILGLMPKAFRKDFDLLLLPEDEQAKKLVKYADRICAYLKCAEEMKSGNVEFADAMQNIRQSLQSIDDPVVNYFMQHYTAGFTGTLDRLGKEKI